MTLIIKTGIVFLNIIYFFIKLLPTKKKVTMISRQSDIPSDEFYMIKAEIERRDPDVRVILLCHTLNGGIKASLFEKVRYCFHMFSQLYHISTSQVVVLDTYCMVISMLKHKKNLKIIQMWHSMGTMKKFGYTALDTGEGSSSKIAYAMRMHENYDYIFASSEAYKQHLADGFRCDINKILTMPLPRLDLLKSEQYRQKVCKKIFKKYPELKEKPIILYCPTFRKDERRFAKAYKRLDAAIDHEKYHFVVKLHPLSKINLGKKVVQIKDVSTFDMLFIADYIISDYSCIIYEAGVLGKPLYFYNFDMDIYEKNRGLAIDYMNELPGVISRNAKTITKAIESGEYDYEYLKQFIEKYITMTDHATADIVDFIYQFIK